MHPAMSKSAQEFPQTPPVSLKHRGSKHLRQLLIYDTFDADRVSACSHGCCSQDRVYAHLGHSHRQEDNPSPQTLSAPEARQLERVPAGKRCSEACSLDAPMVPSAGASEPCVVWITTNRQEVVMRTRRPDAERVCDLLALPGEEGLLLIPGEEEAETGVLPGLQNAVEEVACQPSAPQRDCAR